MKCYFLTYHFVRREGRQHHVKILVRPMKKIFSKSLLKLIMHSQNALISQHNDV